MIDFNATLVAQIINFLILMVLLAKFAYKPLIKVLEERQKKIADSIESAELAKVEAQQLKQDYQEQLSTARKEAQGLVDKAIKLAEQSKEDILEEARQEHARILKTVQAEIAREHEQALTQLKSEVVSLSMAAASKIVAKNLDTEANAKLVNDFIENLDAKKIGGLSC